MRAVVLASLGLLALVASVLAVPASPVRAASARPALLQTDGRLGGRPLNRLPGELPAFEVMEPGADVPVVQPGRPAVKVPILMYHYIRTPPPYWSDPIGWGLSTPPADFAAQMDYLEQNDYHPVTLVELRDYLAGVRTLPERALVLTFDDGYEDFYTVAFPILRQHHFKAVSYVVSGFIGRGSNLSADQIRELDAYGVEIAAHTVDHVDLTKSSAGSLAFEVGGSKQSLEALLGHPVLDFCYPSGQVNARVIAAVQAAGYQSATTTAPGSVHAFGDRYLWTRVRVSGSENLATFAQGLSLYETGEKPTSIRMIRIPRVYPLLYHGQRPGIQ